MLDVAVVTGLLGLAGVPLIVLRGSPWLHVLPVVWGFWAVGLLVTALWDAAARRRAPPDVPPLGGARAARAGGRAGIALTVALLACLTLVTYADPMRRHFWGGYDEARSTLVQPPGEVLWSGVFDLALGRPLLAIPRSIAHALTPGRIEGFLAVAVLLCFLNAVLLLAIVRRLLPGGALAAVMAAALFIANRAEPLRFFPLWTTNFYWMAVFWLLLGVWLLLVSHDHRSRKLLVAACVSLGAALLTSEGLYPLALLGPILLWLRGARGAQLAGWSYAWLGTVTLLAVRLGIYLLQHGASSYQLGVLPKIRRLDQVWPNVQERIAPLFSFFDPPDAVREYAGSWVLALVLTVAALGLAIRTSGLAGLRRPLAWGLGIAALAVALGLLPYVPAIGPWRTQYLAGPGQAALVACLLALVGSFLGRRPGPWLVAITAGVLVASSTVASLRSQDAPGIPVRFEKTAHVIRQLHGISPRLAPDTLVVLVLDEGQATPLGINYGVCDLSTLVLKALAVQLYADPLGHGPTFGPETVAVQCRQRDVFPYEHVVLFRLSFDGTLTLISRLPPHLVPWADARARYRPLDRLAPGPIDEPRFMRYPPWSEGARDVLDTENGLLLGAGWSRQEVEGQGIFRFAARDAEVVVNPAGRDRREIELDVEPAGDLAGRAGGLPALDEAGRAAASARLGGGRQRVQLTLPLDPARAALFRLRVEPADARVAWDPASAYLRVWRPAGGTSEQRRLRWTPADIVGEDPRLRLGRNWYPFEQYGGETFRWFNNQAEIVLDHLPPGSVTLELDLVPGPGLAGRSCDLTVRDANGQEVARASASDRARVRLPLMLSGKPETVFRLHVEGGGAATPGDTRILNCRVFSVRRLPA